MITGSTSIKNDKPTFEKRKGIFNFGEDNNYPNEVKFFIDNSVTASSCAEILRKFIKGKGVSIDYYINKDNETVNDLLSKVSEDIAYFKGFALQIGYNQLGLITSIKHVPFNWVRWGKEDVNSYKSKIKISKNWHNTKEPISEYDFYNTDAVLQQIDKVGFENYKGQIFYAEIDNSIYPKAFIHPAIKDADSELQSSKFKNNLLTKGFLNNLIVVTKKFENSRSKAEFQNNFKSQLGVDGQGVFNHYEADLNSDELDKELFLKEINTNLNDKLFEYTDTRVSKNIIKAFGIQEELIHPTNGVFGNSGELIKQIKLFQQEKTEEYRSYIERVFGEFYSISSNQQMRSTDFKIVKLIEE